MAQKKKPIPIIGHQYDFFDDGKISLSRHYIATIKRVIPLSEADNVFVRTLTWGLDEPHYVDSPLSGVWEIFKTEHDWIMAKNTDFFVECSIPDFDDDPIWFARDINGGWFSMDIQSGWQAGQLDIDGSLYKGLIERMKKYEKGD